MPRHNFTEYLIWHYRILAEICDRGPKPVPVPPELGATFAEAKTATEAEKRTESDAVNAATVSGGTAGLY